MNRRSEMRPRLLLAVNDARFFLSHRLHVAQAASDAGYDVQVATPASPEGSRIEQSGLSWHPIRLSRSGTSPRELMSVVDLARLYQRLRPRLVHHVTPKVVIYGTAAARLARVPAVVNAISGLGHAFAASNGNRDLLRIAASWGYRAFLRHPKMRVIFQNEDHLQTFLNRGWVKSQEAVLVPGSGVDTAVFTPRSTSRLVGPPVIVLAARLLATKGVREFVSAARTIRMEGEAARFVLVGEPDPGNPATVSLAEIEEWVAEGVVEYWGHRSDMPQVLSNADIACLPSYTEGMPKTLIEAASSGLPIITSDEPGCRAVVQPGRNGLLVPIGDVPSLVAALRLLIKDPELRLRFGSAGRMRALREFALERIIDAHLKLYDSLC